MNVTEKATEVARIAREVAADCEVDATKLDSTPFTPRGIGETFGATLAMVGVLAKLVGILADQVVRLVEEQES